MISEETLLIRGMTRQEYYKEYKKNQSPERKEALSDYQKKWYLEKDGKGRVRERYRDTRLEYKQALEANRSAKKHSKPGIITENDWVELKASYSNRCAYCGTSSFKITVDHFEPLSGIGTNELDNIVPACNLCNYAKNSKPFIVFLGWKNGAFN